MLLSTATECSFLQLKSSNLIAKIFATNNFYKKKPICLLIGFPMLKAIFNFFIRDKLVYAYTFTDISITMRHQTMT